MGAVEQAAPPTTGGSGLTEAEADDLYRRQDVPLADGDIPGGVARNTEVTSAVAAEATARDSAIAAAIAALVASAPGTLDTLAEIATALGNDPNLAATLAASIAGKLAVAGHDANSIVASIAGTLADLDVPSSTFLGRKASGNLVPMSVAEAKTLLAIAYADVSGLGTAAQHAHGDYDLAGAAAAAQAAAVQRGNHTGSQLAATISDLAAVVKAYRLDEFAAPTADVPLNAKKITGLADPTSAQDAATRAYVLAQIAALVNSAPGVLDTLGELAAALQSDESTAAALATTVAGKVPLSTVTTADDLIVATGNGTVTRLGVAASRIIGKKASGALGALTAAEVLTILGQPAAPIVVTKSDANLATVNTSSAWVDVDTSGTANARNLDVVIPNVVAGQWVTVAPMFSVTATGAFAILFDIATIVAGAKVHQFGTSGTGVNQWAVSASVAKDIMGNVSYQLVSGDIESGSVRLRLQHISTGARTISAAAGSVFRLEGRGPFG